MKIKLWSDLHLEFRNNLFDHIHHEHEDDKETILLLAGDIALGMGAKDFVTEMCNHFKYVLMIHGNHEYYHNDFEQTVENWKTFSGHGSENIMIDMGPENFHYLYNDSVILDGVRFIGGTMWTDFADSDPMVMAAAHRMMNDYNHIKCRGERITPQFVLREHDNFIHFLLTKFDEPFDGSTVVMSHHSPGNALRRLGHSGDKLDACYYADLEQMIGHHNVAKLWVHGHTHRSWDYMINETRVVCNPYGYWGHAVNPNFDRMIVLEV